MKPTKPRQRKPNAINHASLDDVVLPYPSDGPSPEVRPHEHDTLLSKLLLHTSPYNRSRPTSNTMVVRRSALC